MFVKEVRGHGDSLGQPLQVNNIAEREFNPLIRAAGVKRIKFHGLRHTCATLLLLVGVQPHVVQRRLGHSDIQMTLGTYGHVLPSMQAEAAGKLATVLHG